MAVSALLKSTSLAALAAGLALVAVPTQAQEAPGFDAAAEISAKMEHEAAPANQPAPAPEAAAIPQAVTQEFRAQAEEQSGGGWGGRGNEGRGSRSGDETFSQAAVAQPIQVTEVVNIPQATASTTILAQADGRGWGGRRGGGEGGGGNGDAGSRHGGWGDNARSESVPQAAPQVHQEQAPAQSRWGGGERGGWSGNARTESLPQASSQVQQQAPAHSRWGGEHQDNQSGGGWRGGSWGGRARTESVPTTTPQVQQPTPAQSRWGGGAGADADGHVGGGGQGHNHSWQGGQSGGAWTGGNRDVGREAWRSGNRDGGQQTWRGGRGWSQDNRGWSGGRGWSQGNNQWGNNQWGNNQWGTDRGYQNWNRDWRQDNRYNWQSYRNYNRDIFRLGRYSSPYRGYSYSRLSIGFTLNSLFFGSNYWIDDPWSYRLPEAYGPYRWIRYYDDAVLVDIYSGEVLDVIHDFFW
jgi:hypothetical protein